ncbi:MAG: hypothetical protein ACHQ7M_08265 [Chloroflexota bacterium]
MEPIPMLDSDPAVTRALNLLAPSATLDVDCALGRQLALQARGTVQAPAGWLSRLAVLSRPAVALPIAAALVAALVTLTPARGLAEQILPLFRVQDVAPITVDQVSQPLPDLSKLGDMSPSPREVRMQPTQVTNLGAASSAVGFTVQTPSHLPSGLGPQPSVIATTNGSTLNFTFRAAKARAYLDSTGHPNVSMPAKFDGATLTLHVPAAASLAYLPAGTSVADLKAAASGGKPDASRINQLLNGSGILILEAKSPELDATGVSPDELRDFLLSLPGIPDATKAQLRSIGDWRNTLPVPAAPGSNLHKVSVNGAPGVAGRNGSAQMVLWVKNGMVFVATGPKLDESALLSLASSVN